MFETPNEMYMSVLEEFLTEAKVISRKGRLYLSLKPVMFQIKNLSNTMIMLPGSNYHDPIPWLFSELFDWLSGPVVAGGQSVRFDKHRRTVYPKGNGEDDWSYKGAFGLNGGEGQLDWARRHIHLDPSSRSCVMSPWQIQRDLIRYTARKELELGKAEEYQRLPCITSIQFTTDDTLEIPQKKGLNIMCHQRALDFTGAVHTDVFRLSESAHWIATGAYPNGFAGHLTMLAGTCVVESFGKQRFVEFKNLLEWWRSTPKCLSILDKYPQTNKCLNWTQGPGEAPKQKMYEWYMEQWHITELAVQNAIKGQWNMFYARVETIQYQYYQDFAYTLAIFEWVLQEEMEPEIKKYHWDAPQVKAREDWAKALGKYPPIFFLSKIHNWFHYMASAELTRVFIVRKDYTRLARLINSLRNKDHQDCLLMEASRFLNKKQREALFEIQGYEEFGELYKNIFEED